MKLTNEIRELINNANNSALATIGEDGLNVIPLSMVRLDGDIIIIKDCFMGKTVKNIQTDNRAALSLWKGFDGVQLKGTISYQTEGEHFANSVRWLQEKHPNRTLRGALVFTIEKAYDIHPANAGRRLG